MKITFVSTARSEYGASKWIIKRLNADPNFEFNLVLTGNHFSSHFGSTANEAIEDGNTINTKIPLNLESDDAHSKCLAMAELTSAFSNHCKTFQPDLIMIIGDRFELLPLCTVATLHRIPIAHISGGDITEGAFDDSIRHAVSKLSHLHFPSTKISAEILKQLGEEDFRINVVGEPGIENLIKNKNKSRKELALEFHLNPKSNWALIAFHPETNLKASKNLTTLNNMLVFLRTQKNLQVIATYPNVDPGHEEIIRAFIKESSDNPEDFKVIKSLGANNFSSFLKEVSFIIGNSSSAYFEAPTTKTPAIDLGNRQKGRLKPFNVINCPKGSKAELLAAYRKISSKAFKNKLLKMKSPFGAGDTSEKIVRILKRTSLKNLTKKCFLKA